MRMLQPRSADNRIYAVGDLRYGSPGYLASAISDRITAGQAIIRAHAAAIPQAGR